MALLRFAACLAAAAVWLLAGAHAHAAADGAQQFAAIGDLPLESGETLHDCRLGYRTFGRLDAAKANVVVFTTWYGGTTADLIDLIGPGGLVDASKYYVVAIDALADGVSSSPSNSKAQARMKFPKISIRDMVTSQERLLTRVLHLDHVKAVMGFSMGGMQTFQWLVSFPGFLDKAIALSGSPRLSAYDELLWQSEIDAIERDPAWRHGDYTEQPARWPRSWRWS